MLQDIGNEYFRISVKDKILLIMKALCVVVILDYFFYKSWIALLCLVPVGILYFFKEVNELKTKFRHEGREQFKELLLLSSTNMRAGHSVENALLGSFEDLSKLYGKESFVCRLLKRMSHQKANKKSLESVFIRSGESVHIEEIVTFGQLYEIAYQRSGNLSAIMDKVAATIIENIETEKEIYISLCERQFEMKIMNLMPLMIMFYINLTNNGYFDRMYHNLLGVLVMSGCLVLYVLAYYAGYRIIRIRI